MLNGAAASTSLKPAIRRHSATSPPPPPSLDPLFASLALSPHGSPRGISDNHHHPRGGGGGGKDADGEALFWATRRLEERRKELGDGNSEVAQLHVELGDILERRGVSNDALRHYNEALVILQAANGERHASTAPVYTRLAKLLKQQGRGSDALKHYKEALRILQRSAATAESAEAADTLANIGVTYINQGRVRDGSLELVHALDIYRRLSARARRNANPPLDSGLLVNRTLDLAVALPGLGGALLGGAPNIGSQERALLEGQIRVLCHLCVASVRLGEPEEGIGRQEEAMALQERVFGRESDAVATSLLTVARIRADHCELPEALQGYEAALAVLRRLHRGPGHPRVALCLSNIGVIYSRQGQAAKDKGEKRLMYEAALRMHEEALDTYQCASGGETEDAADTLYNMAMCRSRMGDLMVALDNAEEAARIYVAKGAGSSISRAVQATVLVEKLRGAVARETMASLPPSGGGHAAR